MKSLGQIAYEAYWKAAGGKSAWSGETLPDWSGQTNKIRQCWDAAAQAVANTVHGVSDE